MAQPNLTSKEYAMLVAFMQELNEVPQINFNNIATKVGQKHAENARSSFVKLFEKLKSTGSTVGTANEADGDAEDDQDEEMETTPAKPSVNRPIKKPGSAKSTPSKANKTVGPSTTPRKAAFGKPKTPRKAAFGKSKTPRKSRAKKAVEKDVKPAKVVKNVKTEEHYSGSESPVPQDKTASIKEDQDQEVDDFNAGEQQHTQPGEPIGTVSDAYMTRNDEEVLEEIDATSATELGISVSGNHDHDAIYKHAANHAVAVAYEEDEIFD